MRLLTILAVLAGFTLGGLVGCGGEEKKKTPTPTPAKKTDDKKTDDKKTE